MDPIHVVGESGSSKSSEQAVQVQVKTEDNFPRYNPPWVKVLDMCLNRMMKLVCGFSPTSRSTPQKLFQKLVITEKSEISNESFKTTYKAAVSVDQTQQVILRLLL